MSSRRLLLALALAAAALAAGCGERQERIGAKADPLRLVLDFYVNPDHAGIYEAIDRGYFSQAGFKVSPAVPSDPAAPIKQVAAGRADLAVSYEPEVLAAHDQGLPVVAVAALVQRPLTSLISLRDANVRDAIDLRGKTVATAGIPYQSAFLDAILDDHGIDDRDVKRVDVGLGLLPAVLSGRADAMLGGFLNVEGVDLAERGENPRVVPVDRLGIPTYDELVLVANSDAVADDPEPIKLFLAALERGTRYAAAHPDEATKTILAAGDGLDPALTPAEMRKTLPLLLGEAKHPFGYMNPFQWRRFAGFLADQGVINSRTGIDGGLTNDLLPGRPR